MIPVKEYDVAVIGGGVAGAAAALQAARCGKRAVLVEKTVLLGGLATSGLVYWYLPLCDGRGRQVTFGIAEEFLRRSLLYGPGEVPEGWEDGVRNIKNNRRFQVAFSPAAFMLSLEEALEEAGVDLWLDSLFCGVNCSDGKLRSIELENKSGRIRLEAGCFIDATGDADVARRAGVRCITEDNCLSTLVLEFNLHKEPHHEFPNSHIGAYGSNVTRKFTPIPGRADMIHDVEIPEGESGEELYFRGISGRTVSEYMRKSHRTLRDHYRAAYGSGETDRNSLYPVKLPLMPQFRKIYSIEGERTLGHERANCEEPDSVGMIAGVSGPGEVREVPFGALYPKQRVGSLLVAGRSIAATGHAWDAARLIPAAALTGQVCGQAASLQLDGHCEAWELKVEKLQQELNFPLHQSDLPEL